MQSDYGCDITVYVDEADLTEAGAYLFAKFGSGVTASAGGG